LTVFSVAISEKNKIVDERSCKKRKEKDMVIVETQKRENKTI
jgi:hypothetical protein